MRLQALISGVVLALAATTAQRAAFAGDTAPHAAPLAEDEILVVDEKDLGRLWRRTSKRPMYLDAQSSRARRLDAGCVAIGYVIESDGRVRTAKVLRSDPPGVLDEDGLRTARRMLFVPGPENEARTPVYSVVSWSQSRTTVEDATAAIRPCMLDIEVPAAATR